MEHTVFSELEPKICACGKRIHDGSVWVKVKPEGVNMSNDKVAATFHGEPTVKKPPLVARIAAGVVVTGLILWGVFSCGAFAAQSAKVSQCRAELTHTLQEAGSDRAPTEREVQACVASP